MTQQPNKEETVTPLDTTASAEVAEDASAPTDDTPSAEASPVERLQIQALESAVVEVLKTCFDPEIPVDIYELGLIYDVTADASGKVDIRMTLTSPACPVAGTLPPDVERRVLAIDGVTEAKVEVVWDPTWNPDMMSEAARLTLNL